MNSQSLVTSKSVMKSVSKEINGFGQDRDITFVTAYMHSVTHFICIPIFEYFFKYRITFDDDPVICLQFLFYFP
jgi:hypothetical protein